MMGGSDLLESRHNLNRSRSGMHDGANKGISGILKGAGRGVGGAGCKQRAPLDRSQPGLSPGGSNLRRASNGEEISRCEDTFFAVKSSS